MTIRNQAQALDALTRAAGRIEHSAARYSSGGAATKAAAAGIIAEAMAERASIYRQLPKLYSGRRPARWLAQIASSDAALAMDMQAQEWRMRADRHQAEAEAIERAALPAFADDGLTFVPGRGRVRQPAPVTDEPNVRPRELRALNGGQR
jgi:hypothetical protein